MHVLLIYRATEFSPNNVGKDASILEAVQARVLLAGHATCAIHEEDLSARDLEGADVVFSMARRLKSLILLQHSGKRVINAAEGVMHTAPSRETTLNMLAEAGIAVPPFWAYEPSTDEMFLCDGELQLLLPGWVKAMHPKGVTSADVTYVQTPLEADAKVMELQSQGYSDIVVTKHVEGPVVKVYAVVREGQVAFLRWFLPQAEGYTKFGDERHNSVCAEDVSLDESGLSQFVKRVSEVVGLSVFGFDAILTAEGVLSVIDVNDWPSFSKFREEAADAIAALL